MTNSVAKDMADLLRAAVVDGGGNFDDVYPSKWGKNTDGEIEAQTLIEDMQGAPSDFDWVYENPAFQMTVRGTNKETPEAVWVRAKSIYNFIINLTRPVINGTEYVYFKSFAPLQQIGLDDKGRALYMAKFSTTRDT